MLRRLASALVVLAAALLLLAPQPARREGDCPFARPTTLVVWQSGEVRPTLQRLVSLAEKSGFKVDRAVNWTDGSFEATRPQPREQDRIIVWVERDLADCQKGLKVFLAYARFEEVFGSGVRRVQLDASEEDARVGELRQRIISAGLTSGGNE